MVARPWGWDTPFMLEPLRLARGARDRCSRPRVYFAIFRRELRALARKPPLPDVEQPEEDAGDGRPRRSCRCRPGSRSCTCSFMAWTVVQRALSGAVHRRLPLLPRLRARHRRRIRAASICKPPLLVGFFLAGLVIHGGLQGWWIAPVLASLSEEPLFFGATLLTAFNDNALITYLATLVPDLSDSLRPRSLKAR